MLLAILLSRETLALPFAARQDPGQLALDVDPGFLAESELLQDSRQVVDVQLARELVVVGIA